MDVASAMCVNAYRDGETLQAVLPHAGRFRAAFQVIKLWARRTWERCRIARLIDTLEHVYGEPNRYIFYGVNR